MDKDLELSCSEETLRRFFNESEVWQDIKACLLDGLSTARHTLELPASKRDDDSPDDFIRGRIFQIQEFLQFPETVPYCRRTQDEEKEEIANDRS